MNVLISDIFLVFYHSLLDQTVKVLAVLGGHKVSPSALVNGVANNYVLDKQTRRPQACILFMDQNWTNTDTKYFKMEL